MYVKKWMILLLLVAIKFFLSYYLVDAGYDLHRDEYLHLDQAKHLAWGYDSVPPVTSWISVIILKLGNGVFWVKFFPALFGALTIVMVWKIIEALGGNLFAMITGSVAVLVSAILRVNILYQPNSLEIFCWTIFYYTFIRYIISNENRWLYAAAVAIAFGFLNKYNIIFMLLGLLPAILLTSQRKIFLNKHLYFALLLALLIVAPNIVWQVQNNFPVFHHLKELNDTQLVNVNRADFLKEQVLFFLSSFFILIAAFISFFSYAPFKKFQLFFWGYLFSILLYVYLKAKGYYAIGLYPVLLAFGAVYIEHLLQRGWKRYLQPAVVLIPVLLAIPFIRIAFPSKSPELLQHELPRYKAFGLLRWEDGKDHNLPQDFADMQGWNELAKKVDSAYAGIADKEHTIVYCDNYGQAGAINYYSKYKNINAVSLSADYINWFPNMEIKNIVLVQDPGDDDPDRKRERTLFESVRRTGTIENKYAREYGTAIYVLLNATTSINAILQKEIAERKGH
jgi:Dolichyl-phosphate-mannose-protein mannosyltransferase